MRFREPLLVSLLIFMVGNLMYALSQSQWTILVSRLLVGFGSGSLGVARGYVIATTDKADRTKWISLLSAAQFVGYSVTPGLGALLSFFNIDIIGEYVELDAFTTGGYILTAGGLVNFLLIIFLWKEPSLDYLKKKSINQTNAANNANNNDSSNERRILRNNRLARFVLSIKQTFLAFVSFFFLKPSLRSFGILLFIFLNFIMRTAVAMYETSSQLIATEKLSWTVFVLGVVSCVFGVLGTIVLLVQKPISKRMTEEGFLLAGMFALALGLALFPPVSSSMVLLETIQYVLGSIFIFGVGFPIGQALLISLFSKILGPIPQSTIMGLMASLGSISRIVGAMIASTAFDPASFLRTFLAFQLTALTIFLSSVAIIFYYWIEKRRSRKMTAAAAATTTTTTTTAVIATSATPTTTSKNILLLSTESANVTPAPTNAAFVLVEHQSPDDNPSGFKNQDGEDEKEQEDDQEENRQRF